MTISFGSAPSVLVPRLTPGTPIVEGTIRPVVESVNSLYRFSRSILFSDLRDETQEGVYTGFAPWYCDPYSATPPWQSRVFRLPYRPGSPLPGTNTGVKTTGGTAKLDFWFRGRNIDAVARISRVASRASDFTYTLGTTSANTGQLAGGVSFTENIIEVPFPDNCRSGDLFVLDFTWRSANLDEDSEGYLSGLVISEPLFSDWPA